MLKTYYDHKTKYYAKENLQALINNLEEDSLVKGRVIEHIKKDKYIIRIRGYNIYTQSDTELKKGEELKFQIIQLTPHLILNPRKPKIEDFSSDSHTDIIVH